MKKIFLLRFDNTSELLLYLSFMNHYKIGRITYYIRNGSTVPELSVVLSYGIMGTTFFTDQFPDDPTMDEQFSYPSGGLIDQWSIIDSNIGGWYYKVTSPKNKYVGKDTILSLNIQMGDSNDAYIMLIFDLLPVKNSNYIQKMSWIQSTDLTFSLVNDHGYNTLNENVYVQSAQCELQITSAADQDGMYRLRVYAVPSADYFNAQAWNQVGEPNIMESGTLTTLETSNILEPYLLFDYRFQINDDKSATSDTQNLIFEFVATINKYISSKHFFYLDIETINGTTFGGGEYELFIMTILGKTTRYTYKSGIWYDSDYVVNIDQMDLYRLV